MTMRKTFAALLTIFAAAASANETVESSGYKLDVANSGGVKTIFTATSPVHEVPDATPRAVIEKAVACTSTIVTTRSQETPLFSTQDPDSGLLVANIRVEYYAALTQRVVQSRLTIEAREGRFRMTHSDMRNSVGSSPADLHLLTKIWGTSWERSIKELSDTSEKIAACIKSSAEPKKAEDW